MNKEKFINELKKLNINITEKQIKHFETYKNLLQEYNQKFNLTSITEEEAIYLKHFYDSLCITKAIDLNSITTLLDIGTGAGFPGIPIAIIFNNIKITLVESNAKKCGFLNIIREKLNLKNVEIINERAEDYTKNNREKFDIVTSRAVAHLSILAELEIPALKTNGYFLPLKSNIEEEIKETEKKLIELNSQIEETIEYELPIEKSKRTILKIKKLQSTKQTYPREYNKILKEITNKKNKSKSNSNK
jgi:16S rRNA (guanine527-N7)-methyltransferase